MQISCPVNSSLGIFSKKAKNARERTTHDTVCVVVVKEAIAHQDQATLLES